MTTDDLGQAPSLPPACPYDVATSAAGLIRVHAMAARPAGPSTPETAPVLVSTTGTSGATAAVTAAPSFMPSGGWSLPWHEVE